MRFYLVLGLFLLGYPSYSQLFKKVNPFIGTGGHGHTFPGAASPFGMVQLSPDTRLEGWDGCSGYHYSDSLITGFSHTHLSGTGCSDYGDIMLMPVMKEPRSAEILFSNTFYRSRFSHAEEKAHAGFYSVMLEDDQILAELTTTERVGFHQYTVSFGGDLKMILDLTHRDELLGGKITQVDGHTLEGYRRSKAWAVDQWVYFRIEFSKDAKEFVPFSSKKGLEKTAIASVFSMKKGEKLLVKVSLSSVSEAGAGLNMRTEIHHWDFLQIKSENESRWENELSKISIRSKNPDKEVVFYTALYHSFLQPNILSDADGKYRGRDGQIHQADGFQYYSVFSLWDTFRSAHPLYNLVQRNRNLDFIKTFLAQYKQGGRLPVWELWSNETDCMIGYHSVSVIADAWAKGIRDFDKNLAVEAMLNSASRDVLGLKSFKKLGYIPSEDESESVSKTLEYAYDDWCISTLLEGDLKQQFQIRSQGWKHLFDLEIHLFRPRFNGGWIQPFKPREVNNHFTEANAWQYGFFVPHAINELIEYHGGRENFVKKLDELFTTTSQTEGRTQVDITGLIGQYAHGNEPSHHMAWLYSLAGEPGKGQMRVRQILESQYKNAPDGLAGNEDCGQMSAWLILSALGIYPVCPGSDQYVWGTPWFDEIQIKRNMANPLVIRAPGAENKAYTREITIDGKPISGAEISHSDFFSASTIGFDVQPEPVSRPFIQLKPGVEMTTVRPAPRILSTKKAFRDSLEIRCEGGSGNQKLEYKLDEGSAWKTYSKPFFIKESASVFCRNKPTGNSMEVPTEASFHRIPHNWVVSLSHPFNPQYSAGGPEGLVDGLSGDSDWRKGGWQGYQNSDFEANIDLKKSRPVKQVSANFLQDTRSWIVLPKEMEVWYSSDGKKFDKIGQVSHNTPVEKEGSFTQKLDLILPKSLNIRYLKIKAVRFGALPDWHPGKGEPSFVFVDEVEIR